MRTTRVLGYLSLPFSEDVFLAHGYKPPRRMAPVLDSQIPYSQPSSIFAPKPRYLFSGDKNCDRYFGMMLFK
ncbi:MAG: hypothetical protein WBA93_28480 [Microcoleaceae cyanobacterium]